MLAAVFCPTQTKNYETIFHCRINSNYVFDWVALHSFLFLYSRVNCINTSLKWQLTLVLYAEWEFEKQMLNSDSGMSSPFGVKHAVVRRSLV
jgi:hypothetical protein